VRQATRPQLLSGSLSTLASLPYVRLREITGEGFDDEAMGAARDGAGCEAGTLSAMRSVQVLPGMNVHRLMALLDSVGERAGSEWFGIAGGRLEVGLTCYDSVRNLVDALEKDSFSASEIAGLRRVGNELAGVWVEVRVSGRGDFQAAMLDLVELLLAEGGYAFDDYSQQAWSLDQIRRGRAAGQTLRA
jgi:hypothetical protein